MRSLIALLIAAVATAAVDAAPAPSEPAGEERAAIYNAHEAAARAAQEVFGPDPTCPRLFDPPKLVVPVVSDGRLRGYAYILPRLCLTRSSRLDHMGENHLLMDRMVRAAHRAPLELTEDGVLVREETHAAVLEAAGEIIGEGEIDRLDLLGDDILVLR